MRLTPRECKLDAARTQGENAYRHRTSMPDFDGDKGMQEAWKAGYKQAQDADNAYYDDMFR